VDDYDVLQLLEEKTTPDIKRRVSDSLKKELGKQFSDEKGKEPPIKPPRKTLPRPPLADSVLIKASSLQKAKG